MIQQQVQVRHGMIGELCSLDMGEDVAEYSKVLDAVCAKMVSWRPVEWPKLLLRLSHGQTVLQRRDLLPHSAEVIFVVRTLDAEIG